MTCIYLPLSYRGWTTVMRHWPVFWPACSTDSSLSSMRQLGQSPVFVARSILQMLSPVSTGFERRSASSSSWWSLSTELFTALHLSTYQASFSTSPIYRRDVEAGCARRPPVSLTYARHDLLLSAIDRLLLLAHVYGTLYLSKFSLPRHSKHFARKGKHTYFDNHIQTLLFHCFSIVVLEVSFTQATLNSL